MGCTLNRILIWYFEHSNTIEIPCTRQNNLPVHTFFYLWLVNYYLFMTCWHILHVSTGRESVYQSLYTETRYYLFLCPLPPPGQSGRGVTLLTASLTSTSLSGVCGDCRRILPVSRTHWWTLRCSPHSHLSWTKPKSLPSLKSRYVYSWWWCWWWCVHVCVCACNLTKWCPNAGVCVCVCVCECMCLLSSH